MKRVIQISDNYFWGFNKTINLNEFKNFDDLALFMKNNLILFLKSNNLLNLAEIASKLNLHNHNYNNYEDLYKTNENDIIYLCGADCL